MSTARAPSLGTVNTVAMDPSLQALNLRTGLAAIDRKRARIDRCELAVTNRVKRLRSAGRREKCRLPSAGASDQSGHAGTSTAPPDLAAGTFTRCSRSGPDRHPASGWMGRRHSASKFPC